MSGYHGDHRFGRQHILEGQRRLHDRQLRQHRRHSHHGIQRRRWPQLGKLPSVWIFGLCSHAVDLIVVSLLLSVFCCQFIVVSLFF